MLKQVTEKLLAKENLTFDGAYAALESILTGQCDEVSVAGYLTALAAKGEVADEIAGMASALRDHSLVVAPESTGTIDIVGTGGDGMSTFNISTTAAIVAAGAGVKVAKHGNRAITSKCGSGDVLAGLGVNLDASAKTIAKSIDQAGIGFMFAPNHHPTMKYVQPVRKKLGFRTVFNILGPMSNPARVKRQVIGVAKPYLLDTMAKAMDKLGIQRAMVVYGDGMDELTICGTSTIVEVEDGEFTHKEISPEALGLRRAKVSDIAGNTLEDNVAITRGILSGSDTDVRLDVVLLNAAAAIMVSGSVDGFADGIDLARESINSGKAMVALEKMVEISNAG